MRERREESTEKKGQSARKRELERKGEKVEHKKREGKAYVLYVQEQYPFFRYHFQRHRNLGKDSCNNQNTMLKVAFNERRDTMYGYMGLSLKYVRVKHTLVNRCASDLYYIHTWPISCMVSEEVHYYSLSVFSMESDKHKSCFCCYQ